LGAESAVAEAVVGMTSAAHASISHEAPAAARIVAAKMLSFAMRARLDMDEL
jgi:methionine-rich copper-binding protein CopC